MSNSLIKDYEHAAKLHGNATTRGDSRAANKAHAELVEAFKKLREDGELQCLDVLLNHSDPFVRCWAATHFLLVDEERATGVLKALTKAKGIVSFNAEMVLKEWRAGRLRYAGLD